MKKERMRILDLLEQGKISAEEATRLLEVLKASSYDYDDDSDCANDIEDRLNAFSKNMDAFAKDLGDKMSGAFKDVEPKVRNVTRHIISKTAGVMDEISKSLNETIRNMEGKGCCCEEEDTGECCEAGNGCCEEQNTGECCEADNGCREEQNTGECCEADNGCCDDKPREN